ncbi:MAG: ComEC/Rec2 family competence protein, partial [Victivallaceae bacterium]
QRYNLTYGEKLHVSGVLEFPAPPLTVHRYQIKNNHAEFISNSAVERFDYAGYLANQNIAGTFNAEHLSATQSAANSIQGEIYQIRNRLLHLVTAGMVNDRDKNLTAGLLFGFRQGSGDNAAKAQYVDSGTIHIFSVSGLHVGILALILFAVLRILPWRWRYGLVIILLLLYVAATGANAPAMRAWVMISCFCISRMLKLNLTPVNAVLWAGVIILYYTPGQLLDIG